LRDVAPALTHTYLLVLAGTVSFAYYASTDPVMAGAREKCPQGADMAWPFFLTVIFTQIVVLLLMAPVFSAASLTIEKEQRTLAGLLTSLLNRSANLVGEVCCSAALSSSVALQRLAFAGNLFCIRRVEPMELLKRTGSTILVLASNLRYRPLVLAIFRRSVHSTAACYGIVLVLSVVTAVAFGILVSHWQSSEYLARGEGPPAYIQAPLFLNPTLSSALFADTGENGKVLVSVSSWLLFTALGCLAAAFAMRSIQRSGEQL